MRVRRFCVEPLQLQRTVRAAREQEGQYAAAHTAHLLSSTATQRQTLHLVSRAVAACHSPRIALLYLTPPRSPLPPPVNVPPPRQNQTLRSGYGPPGATGPVPGACAARTTAGRPPGRGPLFALPPTPARAVCRTTVFCAAYSTLRARHVKFIRIWRSAECAHALGWHGLHTLAGSQPQKRQRGVEGLHRWYGLALHEGRQAGHIVPARSPACALGGDSRLAA